MVSWPALTRALVAEFGCDLPAARIAAVVAEHARDSSGRAVELTPVQAMRQLRLLLHLALRDPVSLPA